MFEPLSGAPERVAPWLVVGGLPSDALAGVGSWRVAKDDDRLWQKSAERLVQHVQLVVDGQHEVLEKLLTATAGNPETHALTVAAARYLAQLELAARLLDEEIKMPGGGDPEAGAWYAGVIRYVMNKLVPVALGAGLTLGGQAAIHDVRSGADQVIEHCTVPGFPTTPDIDPQLLRREVTDKAELTDSINVDLTRGGDQPTRGTVGLSGTLSTRHIAGPGAGHPETPTVQVSSSDRGSGADDGTVTKIPIGRDLNVADVFRREPHQAEARGESHSAGTAEAPSGENVPAVAHANLGPLTARIGGPSAENVTLEVNNAVHDHSSDNIDLIVEGSQAVEHDTANPGDVVVDGESEEHTTRDAALILDENGDRILDPDGKPIQGIDGGNAGTFTDGAYGSGTFGNLAESPDAGPGHIVTRDEAGETV